MDVLSYYAWQVTAGEDKVMAASEELYHHLERHEITSVDYEIYEIMKLTD